MKNLYRKIGLWMFPILLPLMRLFLNRSDRVYVAIIYNGKVLLVKNWLARDTWRLPGGGVNKGEEPEKTAIREVKEELRLVLNASNLKLLFSSKGGVDGMNYPYKVFVYNINIFPKVLPDNYEIVDFGLFDSMPDDASPDMAEVFKRLNILELV